MVSFKPSLTELVRCWPAKGCCQGKTETWPGRGALWEGGTALSLRAAVVLFGGALVLTLSVLSWPQPAGTAPHPAGADFPASTADLGAFPAQIHEMDLCGSLSWAPAFSWTQQVIARGSGQAGSPGLQCADRCPALSLYVTPRLTGMSNNANSVSRSELPSLQPLSTAGGSRPLPSCTSCV